MVDQCVATKRRQEQTLVPFNEEQVIARILARDLEAFEQLYRAYHPRLTRFLARLLHRPQLVEEVLNDTMMVVWDRLAGFNGSSKLSTWIFAIGYRKAMRALRRHDEPADDAAIEAQIALDADPEDSAGRQRTAEILHEAMNGLSPDHRKVVHLTYFQEIGYREIAEIMDCPVDTVKTRMFHARRHLKRMLSGALADWL